MMKKEPNQHSTSSNEPFNRSICMEEGRGVGGIQHLRRTPNGSNLFTPVSRTSEE